MLDPVFHCEFAAFAPLLKQESAFFTRALQAAFVAASVPDKIYTVDIILTDAAALQKLNRDFRGKDRPTNVLSFPQIEDVAALASLPEPVALGDIFLAYETLAAEAVQQGKSLRNHVAHLLVIGFWPLVGYDHQNDVEAEEMEALEIKILAHLGIQNPY